ncbi:hypothetical protein BMT54_11845 [Pasteurellaceae bacterium 15-036681]|nr:hypothetical protein BMT54_11845 [Pasteurellaceae bacterium 15-036681]
MKKIFLVLAYVLPYFSLLLIEFLYTFIYEDSITAFFEVSKFTDPIIPGLLATPLAVFLGKIISSNKGKNKN